MAEQRMMILAVTVAALAGSMTSAPARAQIGVPSLKCQQGVAKEGGRFVDKALTVFARCNDRNLASPGSCSPGALQDAIAKLEDALRQGIAKRCAGENTFALQDLGYACLCGDPDPDDGFTVPDLIECMIASHEAVISGLVDDTYGTTMGPLSGPLLKCQAAIAIATDAYASAKLKLVAKCRDAINRGRISGLAPDACATGDPKTALRIEKAARKARGRIAAHCTDEMIAALDVCPIHVLTVVEGQQCLLDAYDSGVDSLIGIEYASPPPSDLPFCGDGVRNTLDEECDLDDDSACVGGCGAPNGDFPCLCLTVPRQSIIEHGNQDLDLGWTGIAHDTRVPEGRYLVDLYDCDPALGDGECTIGPSCSSPPHSACENDGECASRAEGTCRKRRTALGPHCNLDVQTRCTSDGQCPGCGNFCVKQLDGPPLPVAAGGVPVCMLNVFADDVLGTTNLATGSTRLRIHHDVLTYLGPTTEQPCPVCGGFCAGNLGNGGSPGARTRCANDADCPSPPGRCVTEDVCAWGPNADRPCRPDAPFGAPTDLYGTTSIDCPPLPGFSIAGPNGLDVRLDATTDAVTLPPAVECNDPAFSGERCVGSTNAGRPCASASDCPGGSCSEQCFCPSGTFRQRPSSCSAACVSTGADDRQACASDADCPTGFCHPADCRVDPADTDSAQEGHCGVAPESQCFVNAGIVRSGAPGVVDRTFAAVFCVPAVQSSAVSNTIGLPGPGALTQAVTVTSTGF